MPGWVQYPRFDLVTRSGEIYQLADLQHGTWHAVKRSPTARIIQQRSAPPNLYSVGIEHEGMHKDTQGRLTAEQYKATLELYKHIIQEYEATYKEPFQLIETTSSDTMRLTRSTAPSQIRGRSFPGRSC